MFQEFREGMIPLHLVAEESLPQLKCHCFYIKSTLSFPLSVKLKQDSIQPLLEYLHQWGNYLP